MASLYKSDRTPFWQAKGSGFNGEKLWMSTKVRDKGKALIIANAWEKACKLASERKLTTKKGDAIITQVEEATENQANVMTVTKKLVNDLLKATDQERIEERSFKAFSEEWLEKRKTQTADSTFKRYKGVLARFLASLGDRANGTVDSITNRDVQAFIDAEIRGGRSSSTAKESRTVLSGIFAKAIAKQEINFNPAYAPAIDIPRQQPDKREKFESGHVRLLLQHASVEWRGMILLGFQCGLRLSDAANLTWESVNLMNRTLTYKPLKTLHTSGKTVTTAIHRDIESYLSALPGSDDVKAPIFPTLCGTGTDGRNGLSNQFSRIMDRAGIARTYGQEKTGEGRRFSTLSFHSLRHSLVSRLSDSGIDADVRMQMVGHASREVHQGYTHIDQVRATHAVDMLDSVI